LFFLQLSNYSLVQVSPSLMSKVMCSHGQSMSGVMLLVLL
jgi:hypothetical protein